MLRMNKDETAPEWIDPSPRLMEDVLELKRLTAPEKPAATRCRALESMTDFFTWRCKWSGVWFGLVVSLRDEI